ncbi:hypothetical protein [Salinisphaera sp. G21_0]|uniref:hypothetical protein n=1 Tax=Salinisphaera sp. G21_0 TaxID=2821094 RepID=UPI001ADBF6EB|nr:hypothetical protein [Salinisphaera sp. G21_0]MBO9484384.1 hypothetical protein [Salinisphaera sp. G21_0]
MANIYEGRINMKPLTRKDVDDIVQWGRTLSDEEGTRLLDHFENHQSQLYNAIYGELSDTIAEDSVDMANLFLDLCFDIVLVYHRILGDPQEPEDTRWLESKMALLDAEFKSLSPESPMESKLSSTLNDRFVQRCIDSGTPVALLNYLDDQVLHYASFNSARIPAISLTNNLLFVVVRLMDSIYEYQPEPLSH